MRYDLKVVNAQHGIAKPNSSPQSLGPSSILPELVQPPIQPTQQSKHTFMQLHAALSNLSPSNPYLYRPRSSSINPHSRSHHAQGCLPSFPHPARLIGCCAPPAQRRSTSVPLRTQHRDCAQGQFVRTQPTAGLTCMRMGEPSVCEPERQMSEQQGVAYSNSSTPPQSSQFEQSRDGERTQGPGLVSHRDGVRLRLETDCDSDLRHTLVSRSHFVRPIPRSRLSSLRPLV